MSRLPVCSGPEAVRAFRKLGYEVDHQSGSHSITGHPHLRRLTVPDHRLALHFVGIEAKNGP